MEPLLTGEQVAELLHVPRKLLYDWATRRYGPPVFHIGKFSRYRQQDVERFIQEQRGSK